MNIAPGETASVLATDAGVEALVRDFETGALPRQSWTHAAHLVVALWYVRRYEWKAAVQLMRARIKFYNASHGIAETPTSGYHETITLFWLRAVRAFYARADRHERGMASLVNEMLAALGDKNLPLKFYTRERLMSPQARAHYVEPDIQPDGQQFKAAPLTAAKRKATTITARGESRAACASARRSLRARRRVSQARGWRLSRRC
ncbi:MAG TPA: hypothetical protein VGV59_20130 [Pyrinomonadaceae bacterium]|nr:hypothetical protein [Pyrinomonadaceae bacterium]